MSRRESIAFQNSSHLTIYERRAKAVSDGAAIWFIQHAVTTRATRFAFGIAAREYYRASNPAHAGRTVEHVVGVDFVDNVWSEIVPKVWIMRHCIPRMLIQIRMLRIKW
jgi:hypothetical protein